MKFKCDSCGKTATIHLTEIKDGQKIEKHLCEECASNEGVTIKANVPISQLLEDFILQTSPSDMSDKACEVCGMTFSQFRKKGLLGCPNDYDVFSEALEPLLARAHEGAREHVGKVPIKAGANQKRANSVLRLRAQLRAAVASEDYESAAAIRDRIRDLENT
jgi:protein arginine kinase activator